MFLAALLLFSCCIPISTEVTAAKKKIAEITGDTIILENGRTFYIGDMISVKLDEASVDSSLVEIVGMDLYNYSATEMGATYVSDSPQVLAVDEKSGFAEAKEPGTATVTVNCQGASASFPVTVMAKGTLRGKLRAGKKDITDQLDAAGKKLAKKIPQKLTPENGYDLFRAMKSYLATFTDYNSTYEPQGGLTIHRMLCGWNPDGKSRMAPACSSYERAYLMIKHYVQNYHPIYQKKYWISKQGQRFAVSATTGQITMKMKKKLTKQALLAMYLNDIICEVDGYGPDGAILPLAISTTVQKDRFEAHGYISNYKDKDKRYSGSTVLLFQLGSKTATVTHVYRTRYNPANGRYKYHHKKKLSLKKGKTYYLRIYSLNFYCPGKFVVK